MATIITSVSGYTVSFTVTIDSTDEKQWGVYIASQTDRGLGQIGYPNYPYYVEEIHGTGSSTFSRTYIKDNYAAILALRAWGEVDFALFEVVEKPNVQIYNIETTPATPKAGEAITITASLANAGPSGKVRAVFKAGGAQISDQNSTINTFPGGGLWKPTAPYTMPNSTTTITVDAYGWDGTKWVQTDTKSITRTPSVTSCTGVSLTPFTASLKAGEKVTFTAAVTPASTAFDVEFRDHAGTSLGTCRTSGGSCTFVWDSAGKAPGTYYVKAYVAQGGCQSTESSVVVSPVIRQWNVNIFVKDSKTNNPVSGATVHTGTQTKTTDATGYVQFRVDEGTISISISKTGYNTYTDPAVLVFSDITKVYLLVATGATTGSLIFITVPTGVDIYFNTTLKGTTNISTGVLTILDLPAGPVNYTAKKTGYNDSTGSVTVVGGQATTIPVSLTPTTPASGSLELFSVPPNAEIFIDNTDTGKKTHNIITSIAPGSHTYKLSLAGYKDASGTVTIEAGKTTVLSITLQVLTNTGTLEISSTPAGARIYIDSVDTQKATPATITNLLSGNHTYKLVLSGYNNATGSFKIEAGKTTPVSVPLKKAGAGMGTIIGVGLLGAGVLGAIMLTRK